MIRSVLCVLVVATAVSSSNVTLCNVTRGLEEVVLGRCYSMALEHQNCTEVIDAFFAAFRFKDKEEMHESNYDNLTSMLPAATEANKALFWCDPRAYSY